MTEQRNEDTPRLSFLGPGSFPMEVPVVVPLKPAPARPTIPRRIRPGYGTPSRRDGGREAQRKLKAAAGLKKLLRQKSDAEKSARLRKQAIAKRARLGPWALGFQLGWELGDYLWPNGFYDFGWGQGVPDESVGPEGWSNPEWAWYPCAVQCTVGSLTKYDADFPLTCPVNCNSGFITSGSYDTPLEAHQNQTSHPIDVFVTRELVSPAGFWVQIGQFQMTNYPVEGEWSQTFVGHGAGLQPMPVLRARSSEAPETFPLTQPMEMPFAQPWKEALPARRTQGEGKHRSGKRGRAELTVPRLPLAPFPVVVVVPPGATVPPPPDQIIDVPPPSSGGGGGSSPGSGNPPPTYHTRPPQGRKPPAPRTKEKKLSVRSVANKSWIVLNLATEGFDFIDALFQALPKEIQKATRASVDYGEKGGGKADPYSKVLAIYENFELIDWDKFVNNFINMQLTDMAVGMIGMSAGKFLKMTGQATGSGGLASKPSATADKALEDYLDAKVEDGEMTRAEADEILEGAKLPIPQVEYVDGQWQVSIDPWGLTFG